MAKTLKVGTVAHAADDREDVLVIKIEQAARGQVAARYTVLRRDQSTTENYPGYLLTNPRKLP